MKWIQRAAAFGTLAAAMLLCAGCTKTIDVFDGLEVNYRGYSAEGFAEIDSNGCGDFARNKTTFTISQSSGLRNGDTIIVTATCSAADEKGASVKVKSYTKEYTVSGLLELTDIDPFENLKLICSGTAPANVQITWDLQQCNDAVQRLAKFEMLPKESIYNGDSVTLVETTDLFAIKEKEFKVEGIDVTYPTEIPDSLIQMLKPMADAALEQSFHSDAATWFVDPDTLASHLNSKAIYQHPVAITSPNDTATVSFLYTLDYDLTPFNPPLAYGNMNESRVYEVKCENIFQNAEGNWMQIRLGVGYSDMEFFAPYEAGVTVDEYMDRIRTRFGEGFTVKAMK